MNHRIANGLPRTVDPEHEVVLVTGGASGLGLLIAQLYAMRGVRVAVLDIREVGEKEAEEIFGEDVDVRCYAVNVGERKALEDVREKISKEVSLYLAFVYDGGSDQGVRLEYLLF